MAKATLTLDQVVNFCVFCGKPIPIERMRKRQTTTCSEEHSKAMDRQRMLLLEQKECKYCRRPSTPEERELFKRWRIWMTDPTNPTVAELMGEGTEEVTIEDTPTAEYPYLYTRHNSAKRGKRCRMLPMG